MATAEWYDCLVKIEGRTLEGLLKTCIQNIEEERERQVAIELLRIQKKWQAKHDRIVRWFGWTKLVTPRTLTLEEAETLELNSYGDYRMFNHLFKARFYGSGDMDTFERLLPMASHFKNVTVTDEEWSRINEWSKD